MPPAKRRSTARTDKRDTLNRRLLHIRAEIAVLKRDRAAVRRDEFEELTISLRELHKNTDDLATQLTRIGQIQMEVDEIKRILAKAKLSD
jgi:hypothetical protein